MTRGDCGCDQAKRRRGPRRRRRPCLPGVRRRDLGQRGYGRVREATNGRDAPSRPRAERTELVLLDLHLPDISGYEACASCANRTASRSRSSSCRGPRRMTSTVSRDSCSAPTTTSPSPWKPESCSRASAAWRCGRARRLLLPDSNPVRDKLTPRERQVAPDARGRSVAERHRRRARHQPEDGWNPPAAHSFEARGAQQHAGRRRSPTASATTTWRPTSSQANTAESARSAACRLRAALSGSSASTIARTTAIRVAPAQPRLPRWIHLCRRLRTMAASRWAAA